jgi:hypothetical protein
VCVTVCSFLGVRVPFGVKGKEKRRVGGRTEKEVYTVHSINIIFRDNALYFAVSFPVSISPLA